MDRPIDLPISRETAYEPADGERQETVDLPSAIGRHRGHMSGVRVRGLGLRGDAREPLLEGLIAVARAAHTTARAAELDALFNPVRDTAELSESSPSDASRGFRSVRCPPTANSQCSGATKLPQPGDQDEAARLANEFGVGGNDAFEIIGPVAVGDEDEEPDARSNRAAAGTEARGCSSKERLLLRCARCRCSRARFPRRRSISA